MEPRRRWGEGSEAARTTEPKEGSREGRPGRLLEVESGASAAWVACCCRASTGLPRFAAGVGPVAGGGARCSRAWPRRRRAWHTSLAPVRVALRGLRLPLSLSSLSAERTLFAARRAGTGREAQTASLAGGQMLTTRRALVACARPPTRSSAVASSLLSSTCQPLDSDEWRPPRHPPHERIPPALLLSSLVHALRCASQSSAALCRPRPSTAPNRRSVRLRLCLARRASPPPPPCATGRCGRRLLLLDRVVVAALGLFVNAQGC